MTQIVSRREPARAAAQREVRAAFGSFCDAIRRLSCLTPTQKDVALLLAEATLLQGFVSLPVRSLDQFTGLGPDRRPFAGLGKNDLSLAINGGWRVKVLKDGAESRVKLPGLVEFGIVVVEERDALERDLVCTVLTVIADSAAWGVPPDAWRFSAADRSEWLAKVAACRRAFTPALDGMESEADLLDARAAVAVESAAGDAHTASEGKLAASGGASGDVVMDAREVVTCEKRAANPPGRSECRNADLPMKRGVVPNVGTASIYNARARAPLTVKQGINRTVQLLNCSGSAGETNRLLAELTAEFARAHGQAAAEAEMQRSGGRWRKCALTWPDEFEREVGALRAHISEGGKFTRAAWFMFGFYLLKSIGDTTWEAAWAGAQKKSRNLLNTQ